MTNADILRPLQKNQTHSVMKSQHKCGIKYRYMKKQLTVWMLSQNQWMWNEHLFGRINLQLFFLPRLMTQKHCWWCLLMYEVDMHGQCIYGAAWRDTENGRSISHCPATFEGVDLKKMSYRKIACWQAWWYGSWYNTIYGGILGVQCDSYIPL